MYSKTWKTHVSFSDMYVKVLDITILFTFYIMFRWGKKIQLWCILLTIQRKTIYFKCRNSHLKKKKGYTGHFQHSSGVTEFSNVEHPHLLDNSNTFPDLSTVNRSGVGNKDRNHTHIHPGNWTKCDSLPHNPRIPWIPSTENTFFELFSSWY